MGRIVPLSPSVARRLQTRLEREKWERQRCFDAQDETLNEHGHLGRVVFRGAAVVERDLSTDPGHTRTTTPRKD